MDAKQMQNLINSGMAWLLEGSIGRACTRAIEDGQCMLGQERHRDYWGNVVPSRDDVQQGTKGSYAYVEERYGEEHAYEMAQVNDSPMEVF